MSKVLVDRVELEEAAKWLEAHSPGSGSAEAIAQTAEAEGVEVVAWRHFGDRTRLMCAMGKDRTPPGGVADEFTVPLMTVAQHLAALSAVTAERDRLRDAAGKAIAWLDAEQNGSGVGINRIIKLCRDAENSLRAAMAAKEA